MLLPEMGCTRISSAEMLTAPGNKAFPQGFTRAYHRLPQVHTVRIITLKLNCQELYLGVCNSRPANGSNTRPICCCGLSKSRLTSSIACAFIVIGVAFMELEMPDWPPSCESSAVVRGGASKDEWCVIICYNALLLVVSWGLSSI